MNCFLPDHKNVKEGERGKAAEKAAMKNTLFAHIFGTDTSGPQNKAFQGKVTFYDAYPQSPPVIEADVMNVHYPKYYGEGKAPGDYDSPTPIPFLTVGKCDTNNEQLKFCFSLMVKEENKVNEIKNIMTADIDKLCKKGGQWRDGLNENNTVLEVVNYWLRSALTQHGIGTKTAVGYGYFKKE
jgi:CRISPR-associated protein Cmr6